MVIVKMLKMEINNVVLAELTHWAHDVTSQKPSRLCVCVCEAAVITTACRFLNKLIG